MASSSFHPFSHHITKLSPFPHASSLSSARHHQHFHLQHQQFSFRTISIAAYPPCNASQSYISPSLVKCGLAVAVPTYSSRRLIHRIQVLGLANSSSVGPTFSQVPVEQSDYETSSSEQRRSVGVTGPNFREKLTRFLALKNGHISGLEERIQALERRNGVTLLGKWRFKRRYARIRGELRLELFKLKIERSFILLVLFFL